MTWPVEDGKHLIHRSANRLWGQLWRLCGKALKAASFQGLRAV